MQILSEQPVKVFPPIDLSIKIESKEELLIIYAYFYKFDYAPTPNQYLGKTVKNRIQNLYNVEVTEDQVNKVLRKITDHLENLVQRNS